MRKKENERQFRPYITAGEEKSALKRYGHLAREKNKKDIIYNGEFDPGSG